MYILNAYTDNLQFITNEDYTNFGDGIVPAASAIMNEFSDHFLIHHYNLKDYWHIKSDNWDQGIARIESLDHESWNIIKRFLKTVVPDLSHRPESLYWYTEGNVSFNNGILTIERGELANNFYFGGLFMYPSQYRDIFDARADILFPADSPSQVAMGLCISRQTINGDNIQMRIVFDRYSQTIVAQVWNHKSTNEIELLSESPYYSVELNQYYALKVSAYGANINMSLNGNVIHRWTFDSALGIIRSTDVYIWGFTHNAGGSNVINGKGKRIMVVYQ